MPGSKIKVTIPKGVEDKIKKVIFDITNQDELLKQVGEVARKDIVATILKGKSPETGNGFQNRTLTPEWRKRKKSLSRFNSPVDSSAGGGSSVARLVFTGEWLKSFVVGIVQGKQKSVEIYPDGIHSQYTAVKGGNLGERVPNLKLGEYFIKQGRDWRGVTAKTKGVLVKLVQSYIRRELTKRNK